MGATTKTLDAVEAERKLLDQQLVELDELEWLRANRKLRGLIPDVPADDSEMAAQSAPARHDKQGE